jgi:hypothetical protein
MPSSQCIDTMTELESCGGCRHGVYKPASPSYRVPSPLYVTTRDPLT